jgi:hypothetical protein
VSFLTQEIKKLEVNGNDSNYLAKPSAPFVILLYDPCIHVTVQSFNVIGTAAEHAPPHVWTSRTPSTAQELIEPTHLQPDRYRKLYYKQQLQEALLLPALHQK